MNIVKLTSEEAVIRMNHEEALLLANCINEALELKEEFSIRVGVDATKAHEVLLVLEDLLKRISKQI